MGGPAVSLLWPGAPPTAAVSAALSPAAAEDLNVTAIVAVIVGSEGSRIRLQQRDHFARLTLCQLSLDPEVIGYRQAVFRDLDSDPRFAVRLAEILPQLEELSEVTAVSERYRPSARQALERIVRRLAELELFVDIARQLRDLLSAGSIQSSALQRLRHELEEVGESDTFRALTLELPELRATLTSVRSVTIGVNISPDLAVESASILGFGTERIEGQQALLGRLLGGSAGTHGIAPLRRVERAPEGMQNELERDLTRLLQDVAAPVATALGNYASVSARRLARLGPELGFLLGGVGLVQRLRAAGLPTCQPEIVVADERRTELLDAYDPGLALRLAADSGEHEASPRLVTNPVSFDDTSARVWVLSGPNRSGKTTFTRAVGLVHMLAQAGLDVPARSARLSPVDSIHTHFPSHEQARLGMGRLDQEAEALAAIFQHATPRSLVLLNEALAGTSTFEAVDLATGVLRGLRVLGARAMYVTHLHELGAAAADINATTPGQSLVGSLVSEPDAQRVDSQHDVPRTFRILPGAPHGQSFAAQIAEQHGISYPQIVELLRQRGFDGSG
jgi:DNA mismatch repair protein MutS